MVVEEKRPNDGLDDQDKEDETNIRQINKDNTADTPDKDSRNTFGSDRDILNIHLFILISVGK